MTRAQAIASLRPGAEWVLRGTELIWLDDRVAPPPEDEIAARMAQAPPRVANALLLRYALNETGHRPAWDAAVAAQSRGTRDYWDTEPNPPESSPKLRRIAAAAGVDLAALFDRALAG